MYNFNRNETLLVCEAVGGALLRQEADLDNPNNPLGEWVEDKITCDKLGEKWGVDRKALIQKLRTLDSSQANDLIERAKRTCMLRREGQSEDDALRQAGLG